jgi:KH domain
MVLKNEQDISNNSARNHVTLLGDTEHHLGRTSVAPEVLGPQNLVIQHPTVTPGGATGESSSAIDFHGVRSTPQHHLQVPSHHSIHTIPEDRAASGLVTHPSCDKPNKGCSPDPHSSAHSSATTAGTTSTPSSIANSSSPPPSCDGVGVKGTAGAPPEFPSESLVPDRDGNAMSVQSQWPSSLGEGVMAQTYGPAQPGHVDRSEIAQFNVPSPGEAQRYSSAGFPCAIKLLVSNNVAGSIIGRSGQTISDMQAHSSTRIKLSQTGDYYPGSQDRVCLIQGQIENVKGALGLLLERLYMLQEHQHSQHAAWQPNRSEGAPPFDFVVRILVPSSSCGMIIGKSGINIRQMEEASGVASVRLSSKDIVDPNFPSTTITSSTSERVVTLTGPTLNSCLNCLFIILDGMTLHPDICRYTNMTTSYSRMVPDPFTAGQPSMSSSAPADPVLGPDSGLWDSRYAAPQQSGFGRRVSSSPDLSGSFLGHHPSMPIDARPGPLSSNAERDLRYSPMFGGPSSAYSPLRHQVQVPPRMPQGSGPPIYLNTHMEHPGSGGLVPNSISAPDLLALHLGQLELQSTPLHHPTPSPRSPPHAAPLDYPLFPPQHPAAGPAQPGFSAQLLVPDNMIGSILGRGGKTLNDLQVQSGTRIRISQRGEYMPGTRNRLVTIRGATPENVTLAQYLMSQRMTLPRTATYQQNSLGYTPPISQSYSDDPIPTDHRLFHHHHHHHADPPSPYHHAPPPPSIPSTPQAAARHGPPRQQMGISPPSSGAADHSQAT